MPRYFLTKVWGFDPEKVPLIGFSTPAGREKFLREAEPGDRLIVAGTKSDPTPPEMKGRLLGICQMDRHKMEVEPVLHALGIPITPIERDEDGHYRWPFGLPIFEAERFDPLPDLKEIFGSYLPGQEWALFALDLEEREGAEAVRRVLQQPRRSVRVATLPEIERRRSAEDALRRTRRDGPSGPPPSSTRRAVERDQAEGYAYVFELKGERSTKIRNRFEGVYKIGFTSDLDERLETLNREIRPSVTGCLWCKRSHFTFETEAQAHRFEQHMLQRLHHRLAEGEQEIVILHQNELDQAWLDTFQARRWVDGE